MRLAKKPEDEIRKAVEAELAAKGFTLVASETPDFQVTYHVSIEGKLDVDTPKFVIESDATIVAPLIFASVLEQ